MIKLRLWVKIVLCFLLLGLIILVFKLANNITINSIKSCVEGGNSYEWCIRELKK